MAHHEVDAPELLPVRRSNDLVVCIAAATSQSMSAPLPAGQNVPCHSDLLPTRARSAGHPPKITGSQHAWPTGVRP
jgi:hypothetical protein